MAGHSKWKNIQVRKGAQDAKRGKVFTKVTKEIVLAARMGGGDPANNTRLRSAIAAAKAVNLPKDKIDTAIKKGTGELGAEVYDEISYEGYGPGGVALIVECATDNRNRTVADIRYIFSRNGGNLGETGSVGWMFERKGVFFFPKETYSEDKVMEAGLEAGAEDVLDDGEAWEVRTAPADFAAVADAFAAAGLEPESAELSMVATTEVPVADAELARKIMNLMEKLDDHDDVQKVHANADIADEVLDQLG
ncbi:MAG: YebC/PmpR family DNA-binding transcriptional regulator [Thermodesulfobacteriota bacterium]